MQLDGSNWKEHILGGVFRNRTTFEGTILGAAVALIWILVFMSKPLVV